MVVIRELEGNEGKEGGGGEYNTMVMQHKITLSSKILHLFFAKKKKIKKTREASADTL